MTSTFVVKRRTQLTFGDLRVGVSGIHAGQYMGPDRQPNIGWITGLWFYVRNQPELNGQEWAGRGQRLVVGPYVVEVTEVQETQVLLSIGTQMW